MTDYIQEPSMTVRDFLRRVQWFHDIYPEDSEVQNGAREIINLVGYADPSGTISGKDWDMMWTQRLQTLQARMLGAAILYSDASADEDQMILDISGVPKHYRRPLRAFNEQFNWIMSVGESKGYTLYDSLEWSWMAKEMKQKVDEAENMLAEDDPDYEHVGRVLTKCATAAFCLYTTFTWYSGLRRWFNGDKLSHAAIDLLDEHEPPEDL